MNEKQKTTPMKILEPKVIEPVEQYKPGKNKKRNRKASQKVKVDINKLDQHVSNQSNSSPKTTSLPQPSAEQIELEVLKTENKDLQNEIKLIKKQDECVYCENSISECFKTMFKGGVLFSTQTTTI